MDLIESARTALDILVTYWWAYLPVLLFWLLVDVWGDHNRNKYLTSLDWVMLQIKFPREIAASFKAMEQIFANIHGAYAKDLDWDEKFFEGKVIDWFSFEIAGSGGEINFYIRTLEGHRNLVESSIYAQYPEAEVSKVEDYSQFLEGEVPSEEYDIFGMEMAFIEDDYYPIRTYEYFEDVSGGPRTPRVDPLASLSELLGSLKIGEHAWIQFNVEQGDEVPKFQSISPKDREIAKGIISKTAKIGFNTTIRWVYVAKKDIFSKSMSAAISGMFKQFAAQNLNGFKPEKTTIPKAKWPVGFMGNWPLKLIPYPWEVSGTYFKKKKLFENYLSRAMGDSQIILNTEELATIYHLPSIEVGAPLLERIEARKGTPPSSLPIKKEE
jgi:hypothetical protein